MPACPTALASLDEDNDLYLPTEALCPVHHLTFHAALVTCPECAEVSA